MAFPTPPARWARLGAILERLVASSLLSGAGPRRRVHRPSQSLHADRALPEGDKETQGVDRAAVCGGQALAWDAPLPDENTGEKVNTEALMVATGQNIKRLLAF